MGMYIRRLEAPIEGTLDLDKAWDALDRILRLQGPPVLGDAILARRGAPFGEDLGYGPAKELDVARVAEIADALDAIPLDAVRRHFPTLAAGDVYAYHPGEESDAEELTGRLAELKAFYRGAASRGEGVIAAIA